MALNDVVGNHFHKDYNTFGVACLLIFFYKSGKFSFSKYSMLGVVSFCSAFFKFQPSSIDQFP